MRETYQGHTLFHTAAKTNDVRLLRLLSKYSKDFNKKFYNFSSNESVLKYKKEDDNNDNANMYLIGITPMQMAYESGHVEACQVLKEIGADTFIVPNRPAWGGGYYPISEYEIIERTLGADRLLYIKKNCASP